MVPATRGAARTLPLRTAPEAPLPAARCLPFAALLLFAACEEPAPPAHLRIAGADAERGRALITAHGCGSCHVIPGVVGAVAWVGPPLTEWARRGYVGGRMPNAPENLVAWLRDPQAISPGSAMPNLGLTEAEARDAAAFLYTIGARRAERVPAGMPLGPGEGGPKPQPRFLPRQDVPPARHPHGGTTSAGAAWNSTASAE